MIFKKLSASRDSQRLLVLNKIGVRVLVSAFLLAFSVSSYAVWQSLQNETSSAYECTQVALDDIDPALLTKEERVALLDHSLSKSIDSYSTCVGSVAQAMAASGGGGQGDASDNGSANGLADAQAKGDESNSQQGAKQSQSEGVESPEQRPAADMPPSKQSAVNTRGIIAPADNDKIICKLLFQEITKTQNPDMLKGLKEQYINYKCG